MSGIGAPIATWAAVNCRTKAGGRGVSTVGVVVIGRNEGERLRRCLESVRGGAGAVVYVDSGSSDGSVGLARSLGVEAVELDLSTPFTAARARNAGFERLLQAHPSVEFVQFVDGDSEIAAGWLDRARKEFEARPEAAVVCGRLRERFPDATVYNRLCDLEWDTPVGEAKASGGVAMMRAEAFREVGGFDPEVIAAEDDEVCLRLRRRGWKVYRLDAEMGLHDAAMTRFGQWWRRAVRAGYAYALGAHLHGAGPERHFVRERRGVWAWGFALPAVALAAAWPTWGLSLLLVLLYPPQAWRVYRGARRRGVAPRPAAYYGVACVVAKFPQFLGLCRFYARRWLRRPARIIEHKPAVASTRG
jgi:GT2 family glycosyltransferase